MNTAELTAQLKKGRILPAYYFYGNEGYLKDNSVNLIREKFIGSDVQKGLNYEIFYGKNTPPEQIVNSANTIPLFTAQKLIIIKEADRFSAADLEKFIAYIANPAPTSCLIFVAEKADLRKKFFSRLKKTGAIVKYDHPYENKLPPFILEIAGKFNKKVSREALNLLIEVVGNDLQSLNNEIEKLSIYLGKRETIVPEDIEAVVTKLKISTIFELVDSIGEKNRKEALKRLILLLDSGEPPLLILAMITRQFRLLGRAGELLKKGTSPPEIAKELKIPPFTVAKLIKGAERFSLKEIEEFFPQLFDTDLALKSSRIPKKIILERLIIYLCQ